VPGKTQDTGLGFVILPVKPDSQGGHSSQQKHNEKGTFHGHKGFLVELKFLSGVVALNSLLIKS